jgi:hypothetical protein
MATPKDCDFEPGHSIAASDSKRASVDLDQQQASSAAFSLCNLGLSDERLVNFGADMRVLKILSSVMLVVLLVADTVSMAQEKSSQGATSYVPRAV